MSRMIDKSRTGTNGAAMASGRTRRIDRHIAGYSIACVAAAGGLLRATDLNTTIGTMAICMMYAAGIAMIAGPRAVDRAFGFVWGLAILSGGAAIALLCSGYPNP